MLTPMFCLNLSFLKIKAWPACVGKVGWSRESAEWGSSWTDSQRNGFLAVTLKRADACYLLFLNFFFFCLLTIEV